MCVMKRQIYYGFFIAFLFLQACSSTAKIKNGKMAFQYKNYEKAVEMLPQDFQKAKTNAAKIEIANNIFKSYQYLQNSDKMLEWSDALIKLGADNALDLKLLALKTDGQYANALQFLQDYLLKNKDKSNLYKTELQTLSNIVANQDTTIKIINLKSLNSSASDYGFIISDGKVYFTSNRNGKNKDVFTSNAFSQIYTADLVSDSTFTNVQPFTISDFPYHFAQITFNKDHTEAYFAQCGSDDKIKNDYCKIYLSRFFNAAWTTPKQLTFFSDSIDVAQPFLSPDDNELYFTSNDISGYGGSDIYVSKRDLNGNFVSASNLGHKIHSVANETFPTYLDSILYFSSNRKGGLGGLDIYKTTKNGKFFENVQLMPLGINSGADDFALFYQDSSKIYVSSNRKGTQGKDDIFLVVQTPKEIITKKKEPVYVLQILVKENIYKESGNPNSAIVGTQALENAETFIPFPIANKILYSDGNGKIEQIIYAPADFKVNVLKEGYLKKELLIDLEQIPVGDLDTIFVQKEVILQKIFKNVEIVLENIYYDYDKANIREDAKKSLDALITILKDNPMIKIELAAHTDCRGADAYNLKLSQQRAESVVNYLIEKGVVSNRLVAKGYGETQLLEKCICTNCTEEQHQKNRRTTFKIIE